MAASPVAQMQFDWKFFELQQTGRIHQTTGRCGSESSLVVAAEGANPRMVSRCCIKPRRMRFGNQVWWRMNWPAQERRRVAALGHLQRGGRRRRLIAFSDTLWRHGRAIANESHFVRSVSARHGSSLACRRSIASGPAFEPNGANRTRRRDFVRGLADESPLFVRRRLVAFPWVGERSPGQRTIRPAASRPDQRCATPPANGCSRPQ